MSNRFQQESRRPWAWLIFDVGQSMSDLSILIVCVIGLVAIALHKYRTFRNDAGKKLISDIVDGPSDILPHLDAAGLREASLQFKRDKLGWWQAEIIVGGRKFWLGYHHGELGCSEIGGADISLPPGAHSVCTVNQQVGMLCFQIAAVMKKRPNKAPEPTPTSVMPRANESTIE